MDTQMTGMTWKVCGVTYLISITTCIQFFPATISNKITLSGSSVALQWPFQKTGLSPGVSAVKELTLEICLRLLINCVLSNSIRPHSGSFGAHSHLTLSMILLRSCTISWAVFEMTFSLPRMRHFQSADILISSWVPSNPNQNGHKDWHSKVIWGRTPFCLIEKLQKGHLSLFMFSSRPMNTCGPEHFGVIPGV